MLFSAYCNCDGVGVLQVLKDLNNFAGMFVVNAAFESSAVYRLKSTLVCGDGCG